MKANQIKWLRLELIFFKWIKLFWLKFKEITGPLTVQFDFYFSLVGFLAIIFYFGYNHTPEAVSNYYLFFRTAVWIYFINGFLQLIVYYFKYIERKTLILKIISLIVILFFLLLNIEFIQQFLLFNISESLFVINEIDKFNMLLVLLIFLRQFSIKIVKIQHYFVNPAQLFTFSFIFLILFGSMLLMMPLSTYKGIQLIDAIFTSTSAVCVTGLTSVDVYSNFTLTGKIIILMLIQIGGIGVITFTGFFALFFRGNYSFKDQMMLKDIINKNQLTGILKFIYYIIFSTLFFEGVGAVLFYFSTDVSFFSSKYQHWFFSVFHAVSAFCNAGFSNADQGLSNISFKYNYSLQLIIYCLIIFGGLGYNVYLSAQERIWQRFKNLFFKKRKNEDFNKNRYLHMNLNAKIAINTTVFLLLGGTILVFITEYNNILQNYSLGGKIITSFFIAVTPRTAGFSTVDLNMFTNATCLLVIFLMWIGASPGSTGGGIKTSTFSVALLNAVSLGKGKDRLEIFNREIDVLSIKRAFSVIILSVLTIFSGVLLVLVFDPFLEFRAVLFECFSALGTVGLSLGLTPILSPASKIVIILLMFVGRIGAITLMTGFIKKLKMKNYRYCSEQILIN